MRFLSETLITPAADMTNWQNIIVAVITTCGLITVAYLQFGYRASKKRDRHFDQSNESFMNQWTQNKLDHEHVVGMIDNLGSSLGRSIDRVETQVALNHTAIIAVDAKLDTHIHDHVVGKLK